MGVTPQSSTRGSRPPVCSLESVNHSRLLSQEPREVQKLLRCCQSSRFFYLDLQDIDGRRVVGDKRLFDRPIPDKMGAGHFFAETEEITPKTAQCLLDPVQTSKNLCGLFSKASEQSSKKNAE
ncbi:uncharacterized protein PADG_12141 [Paracoccidioides brasiliensis Pb18]|uniref:Non-haem dioxygenase N-terminal domain-containing protein n=1 Tax=Paracoccidioides brasiliensis (strain Pb18) TaxID=502780 RepID=A0A0A0HU41_PARBD|nr:uncharacterized protein PADG_12141 [Paracoccidioides brasiliensis Pb18]KGM91823.1 hypothetical protein PADG_12141 [Paracoccidioides brasiliensis Pb18]